MHSSGGILEEWRNGKNEKVKNVSAGEVNFVKDTELSYWTVIYSTARSTRRGH